MAWATSRRIAKDGSEYWQPDLVWSLRPVLRSIQIFGIDLDVNQRPSVGRKYAFITFCISIFLVVVYFNLGRNEWLSSPAVSNSTFNVSFDVDKIARVAFGFPAMMTLLAASQFRWQILWTKLQEMDRCNCLKVDSYNQMRKVAVTAISVIILLVLG